jgi:hypothetical protein
MSMLYNYYRPWPDIDFRVYVRQRADVLFIERRFSKIKNQPFLTRLAKDFADRPLPPSVTIVPAGTALTPAERVIVTPTKTWRTYALTQWLRSTVFTHIGWVLGAAFAFAWSIQRLIRRCGRDVPAFCIFIIGLGVIGASLVVSLVEYSQPRYSYPMEWAYGLTTIVAFIYATEGFRLRTASKLKAFFAVTPFPLTSVALIRQLGAVVCVSLLITAALATASVLIRHGIWQQEWQRVALKEFVPEVGFAFMARLPHDSWTAEERPSTARIFEDGRELGPANAQHADIRALGRGHFSFWGEWVHVSTSDNTDPRSNGRVYVAYGPSPNARVVRRSMYAAAGVSALLTLVLLVRRIRSLFAPQFTADRPQRVLGTTRDPTN